MPPTLEAEGLGNDNLSERIATDVRWSDPGTLELRSSVPARAGSVALMRNAVRGLAETVRTEGVGPPGFDAERAADLVLVVTELVTNAVLHSGSAPDDALHVRIVIGRERVEGSVTDPGAGFSTEPGARRPRVDGGLGLFIVGRLARAWGVRGVSGGTQVWFDF